ncbi:response regulator transcription factor [Cryptosporangium arvum]|uniref:Response regulator containing a CheY-like receiver domain and an HTH DNA-binding domain n=1 Tax=Cryptosporangium arvum DSM 44712 TaxID=927661 RepID=A0A010ZU11_9ACTN|nr:response regulator transcription factor [Cryptosporangium arvum]EXG80692.1 response regulator containing a CheY-like receiver domain and an HTH DNA-binding domain [Cryptosporangium arvum DSM 44712]
MTVSVLIVDDDALVRAGLEMMLGQFDDLTVVGAVGDGADVLPAVNRLHPDVVLMDIRMPLIDGLTATEQLRARRDPPEVIVLTTFDTDRHIRRAMRAGASGFLLKHTPPEQIARSIRQVAAGEPILSPAVVRRVMAFAAEPERDPRRDEARRLLGRLTDGERAVAALVGLGRTNSEIGRELLMSTATVKAYMTRILTKLDLTNRVQVALVVHDAE